MIMMFDVEFVCMFELCVVMLVWWLCMICVLCEVGVLVGVSIVLVILFVIELDMECVLEVCVEVGVMYVSYIILRLLWEVVLLFKSWFVVYFFDCVECVMNCVCDMCGGKDYDLDFLKWMKGEGIWVDLLW